MLRFLNFENKNFSVQKLVFVPLKNKKKIYMHMGELYWHINM